MTKPFRRLQFELRAEERLPINVPPETDLTNLSDSLFDRVTDRVRNHRPDWEIVRWYWVDEDGNEIDDEGNLIPEE